VSRGFLLDTNVPSELTKPMPDRAVKSWVNAQDNLALHFSAISVGELRKGISLLAHGKRRTQLEEWFEGFLLPFFGPRVMAVTPEIGDRWGRFAASRKTSGKPLGLADGLIAATAFEHGLTLVTRNAKDFADLGLAILNPWDSD
jgi:predicted nucleic acid-binding protein